MIDFTDCDFKVKIEEITYVFIKQRRRGQFSTLKYDPICNDVLASACFGTFKASFLNLLTTFWLRTTDEGFEPDMRIWSILLIKFNSKWCIHFSRILFLYGITYRDFKVKNYEMAYLLFRQRRRGCNVQF